MASESEIAHLLKQNQQRILDSWIESVRQHVDSAQDHSRIFIKDHIDEFLASIREILIKSAEQKSEEAQDISKAHGQQRVRPGTYNLNDLILEYQILRTVIFNFLDDHTQLPKHVRKIINEEIDKAIRDAAVIFEQELRKKEDVLAYQNAILSSASDIMWQFDRDHRFTFANHSLLDLWGLPWEQAQGKTVWELGYEPEVARQFERDSERAFQGYTVRSETPYTNPLGRQGYFEYVISPIKEANGEIKRVAGISRDITDQKKLEKDLERARNELYEFFMQAPVPLVILTGKEFKFTLANPPYEKLIGRKTVGKTVLEVFSQEEVEIFIPMLNSVLETGTPVLADEQPLNLVQDDGNIRNIYVSVGHHPFRDSDGSIKGILAVVQDVTFQVLARREVERRVTELTDILNSTSDGFLALDADFNVTQVNKQHVLITGIPEEEQLGKNFFELFPGTKNPDSEYWKSYHKVMQDRAPLTFVDFYESLNLWSLTNAYPKEDGGIAAFYKDITDEKNSSALVEAEREKFEAIFIDSPAYMALLKGEAFVFEKVNPKYQSLFENRQIVGKPLLEALPELQDGPLPELMKKVWNTGESFYGKEMLIPLYHLEKGMIHHYFDFTYSLVKDGGGNPYGIYIHAMDVTDKVDAQKKLTASVSARDEFLSIASHELKTPLTSLKLQIQSARKKLLKGHEVIQSKEALSNLFEKNVIQVDRLVRLVDDMLDLSRIQLGKLSYNFSRIDLCALLRDIHGRFCDSFEVRSAHLSLECEGEAWGDFDRERIEQVIVNLLTNAMKYGKAGAVQIKLVQDKDTATISVADQGQGIRPENYDVYFKGLRGWFQQMK